MSNFLFIYIVVTPNTGISDEKDFLELIEKRSRSSKLPFVTSKRNDIDDLYKDFN